MVSSPITAEKFGSLSMTRKFISRVMYAFQSVIICIGMLQDPTIVSSSFPGVIRVTSVTTFRLYDSAFLRLSNS